MTTTNYHPDDRIYVFDSVGLLATITPAQLKEAQRRREVRATEYPDRFVLVPQPLNELTGAQRRALELKKGK